MTDPMQRHPAGNRVPRKRQRAAEHDDRTAPSLLDHLGDVAGQVAEGERRKQAGMARADHAADLRTKSAIDRWIAERDEPFTAEDLRAEVAPLASSPNVIGARINAASRRGEIVMLDHVQATRPEAHGRYIKLWAKADGGGHDG